MSLGMTPFLSAESYDFFMPLASSPSTTGRVASTEMMLTTPYWLAGPRALAQSVAMTLLPNTAFMAADWLAIIAAQTASQLNDSSFNDAIATPPMMGMSVRYTCQAWTSRRKMISLTAENAGSHALRIWPKETAPAPRATTEPPWAPAAKMPTGAICIQFSVVIEGFVRMPKSQRGSTHRTPVKSWQRAIVHTSPPLAPPRLFSAFLL
mmetsp:Transcript_56305/g.115153  ORF Transcript_56305/g.115153 Transcript_56305/m.115153 type:complete len:208 (-) Transcript_56305:291-914(-)